jgi:hypothetical protein
LLTLISFTKAYFKKYSQFRRSEAERYFNGSLLNNYDNNHKERLHTNGLALIKNKNGEFVFRKQSKICDTALLYS